MVKFSLFWGEGRNSAKLIPNPKNGGGSFRINPADSKTDTLQVSAIVVDCSSVHSLSPMGYRMEAMLV